MRVGNGYLLKYSTNSYFADEPPLPVENFGRKRTLLETPGIFSVVLSRSTHSDPVPEFAAEVIVVLSFNVHVELPFTCEST